MLFINLHMVDKVTVAIIFAKHQFNFVVIFRNNDQQCSYKIYLQSVSRTVILHLFSKLCCNTTFYQYSSKLHNKRQNNSNTCIYVYLKWTGTTNNIYTNTGLIRLQNLLCKVGDPFHQFRWMIYTCSSFYDEWENLL